MEPGEKQLRIFRPLSHPLSRPAQPVKTQVSGPENPGFEPQRWRFYKYFTTPWHFNVKGACGTFEKVKITLSPLIFLMQL